MTTEERNARGLARLAPAVVLDLEGVDFVDSQGAAKLTDIKQLADGEGVTLRLARVKPHILDVLRADGLLELIGTDHIHGNVDRAIEAELSGDRRS